MDDFNDDYQRYGYPDDYEAGYGAGSDDGWDMARADGCEPCGIGADELEIIRSGFMGLDYVIACPYCGDVITGGTIKFGERLRNVWVVMVEGLKTVVSRLVWRMKRAKSGGDAGNMSDIPF